jgi:UTP--glucose-1-phosphate uridylyltransferase
MAPSNNAVIGRYILPKIIFNKLSKLKPGKGGEIHVTDAIQSLIKDNDKFIGHKFSGKYLDCGTMKGYINSSLKIAKI